MYVYEFEKKQLELTNIYSSQDSREFLGILGLISIRPRKQS